MMDNLFPFDAERIQSLKSQLQEEFYPLLAGKSVHFLDIPVYLNVGDLMIHAGTETLLNTLRTRVKSRTSVRNVNVFYKKDCRPSDILLCHGGGNFGDIYPAHQEMRLELVRRYPDNPIIILPQSVHFNDKAALQETIRVMSAHKNLKMYVRDVYSYNELRPGLGDKVKLMPDMAHMLFGSFPTHKPKEKKTLLFRRRDVEKSGAEIPPGSFDWEDLFSARDNRLYSVVRRMFKYESRLSTDLGSGWAWNFFMKRTILKAAALYAPCTTVDTDRLHGAIFAGLNGCDVILRDNSYGKLSRYFSKWFK